MLHHKPLGQYVVVPFYHVADDELAPHLGTLQRWCRPRWTARACRALHSPAVTTGSPGPRAGRRPTPDAQHGEAHGVGVE